MNRLLKQYRAFPLGALVTFVLTFTLAQAGFLNIRASIDFENIFIFGFWWIAISLVIYKVDHSTQRWKLVKKILMLLGLLLSMITVDVFFDMPDNPFTLTLMVAFWLYIFYLLSPKFVWKYRLLIFGIYAFLCLYFFYFRLSVDNYMHDRGFLIPLFWAPIPLFIVIWFYDQWKWFQSLKLEKNNAELALLKSQINPHFFFNTLNNLYSLTVNQSSQAPEVILKLSDMMRYTIYEGKKELVPIEEEIAYLQNYIELHKIRHHQQVSISFAHETEKGILVSPLLFIILLENAFKHGVETLTENAFIKMKLKAHHHQIHFSIQNNFDLEGRSEVKSKAGIGLENLTRRLNLVYPAAYQLELSEEDNLFSATLNISTND